MELVSEIGRRLTEVSHEPWSTMFLRQRLAVAVQRGNASCIIGISKIDHHVKWHYVIAVIDLNITKWLHVASQARQQLIIINWQLDNNN